MGSSVWRKKPLEAYEQDIQKSQLNRVLGRGSLTAMGIGALPRQTMPFISPTAGNTASSDNKPLLIIPPARTAGVFYARLFGCNSA
ncbi:MAG: hypothetical protein BGO21_07965 [Dyadobacter sp. 50-39]|nr:MAG: hypothetical protein BGO21_07965 [Dyadobacter sp. 50-39]